MKNLKAKQVSNILKGSNAGVSSALKAAGVAYFHVDSQGNIDQAYGDFAKVLGLELTQEFTGTKVTEFLRGFKLVDGTTGAI